MVYVSEMARRKELNEALLHQLVRNNQTVEFVHAFAKLAEVDVKTVRRIVNACNVEGVAIICKAVRFDRSTFSAIAHFLDQSGKRDAKSNQDLVGLYDQVTAEAAQRVMRFWRVRKEATESAPLAQVG
jgi:uncharacterized protein (DUF2336 family)